MTMNEFRAWLEGYSASFTNGTPNADQWAEVQRRLALVTADFVPLPSYPKTFEDGYRFELIPPLELRPTTAPTYFPGGYTIVTCRDTSAGSWGSAQ